MRGLSGHRSSPSSVSWSASSWAGRTECMAFPHPPPTLTPTLLGERYAYTTNCNRPGFGCLFHVQIFLEADLISVDPVVGVAVIDWYIVNDSTCQVYGAAAPDCANVGIYFESCVLPLFSSSHLPSICACSNPLQCTLDVTGGFVVPSNEPPSDLVFVYYPNATASVRSSISAWRTSIAIVERHSSKLRTGGYSVSTSLRNYPFDV